MKQRVSLTIEQSTWLQFRGACIQHGLSAGEVVEEMMKAKTEQFANEKKKVTA